MPKTRNLDDIRIGKNIKAIKDANNLTWEEFDRHVHIGLSRLQKADSGEVSFSDEDLRNISKTTYIPFYLIKNLSNEEFIKSLGMQKKSRSFISEKMVSEIIASYFGDIKELFELCFPIIITNESLDNKAFNSAIDSLKKLCFINKGETIRTIELFAEAIDSGVDSDVCWLNIQSILGLHYLEYTSGFSNDYELKSSANKKFNNELDAFKYFADKRAGHLIKERKRAFFYSFKDLLGHCFNELLKSERYKEYEEFFLVMRYKFEMDEFEMSIEERDIYFEAMMAFLIQTKNRVALKFVNR